ncbi:hypothetical protein PanWU01x14_263870 [Parasponia andersonii]|uniref:Uncharacterized protein n=1 Tax=Parasponia andersonii TaxID=3476 RepID=A0A2P5B7M6_PARAD|nr:hypothetical protein PanWU01x14_263870 [Parasponia andersonii]
MASGSPAILIGSVICDFVLSPRDFKCSFYCHKFSVQKMSENRNKLCILFTTEDENRGLSTNVDVDETASTKTNDISEKIIETEVTINDKKQGKRKRKRELYKQKRRDE